MNLTEEILIKHTQNASIWKYTKSLEKEAKMLQERSSENKTFISITSCNYIALSHQILDMQRTAFFSKIILISSRRFLTGIKGGIHDPAIYSFTKVISEIGNKDIFFKYYICNFFSMQMIQKSLQELKISLYFWKIKKQETA